jgi:hypothetical protein
MRRRLVVLCLGVALALPAAAWAVAPLTGGDGSLAVRDGAGFIRLNLRSGAILGRIENGTLEIVDPDVNCDDLLVWDADSQFPKTVRDKTACVFRVHSEDDEPGMRFRLARDENEVRLRGSGLWVSAVGRGRVFINGAGSATKTRDGSYSLNGGFFKSLPNDGQAFVLGSA